VHGLTAEILKDEPTFGEIVGDFMDFIGDDAKLVAHNAEFDMKFINAEIKKFGYPKINQKRVVDTLMIARQKFPGSPANLDALCRRFRIDNTSRTLHGALLDSELLAEVYLELLGGRQQGLGIDREKQKTENNDTVALERTYREPREFKVSDNELSAHNDMLDDIKDPIWKEG
jgi:DNA polymerase-3 subunit epsilon